MDRVVKVLKESEVAVMTKTVVGEFDFPEFIVTTIGPFPTERVFKYDQHTLAENYYNYLSNDLGNRFIYDDLYFDRSHSISKW